MLYIQYHSSKTKSLLEQFFNANIAKYYYCKSNGERELSFISELWFCGYKLIQKEVVLLLSLSYRDCQPTHRSSGSQPFLFQIPEQCFLQSFVPVNIYVLVNFPGKGLYSCLFIKIYLIFMYFLIHF